MERIAIRGLSVCIGEDAPLACETPCSLQGILAEAEYISHPFIGQHLARANELAQSGCTFSATVSVKKEWEGASLLLCIENVQGTCRVLLNDVLLGTVKDMYRTFEADISALAQVGDNALTLAFDAPGVYALGELPASPAVCDIALGGITLCVRRQPSITRVSVRTRVESSGAVLHVKAHLYGADRGTKVVATLTSAGGKMYYAGLPDGEGDVLVADPLMWRVGAGETSLYRLSVSLYRDDVLVDEAFLTVGLTDIRVLGEASHGRRELSFLVNGERTFIKSCTYFRPSLYPSSSDMRAEEDAVHLLAEAGFTMVRIPAVEPFPSEHLLSLLDRYGILLWKTLPSVPDDAEERARFLAAMQAQLERCATHPCLAMVTAPGEEKDRVLREVVRAVSGDLFFMNCVEIERPNHTAVLWDTTDFNEGVQIEGFSVSTPPASLPTVTAIRRFAEEDRNLYGRTVEYHALGIHIPSLLMEAADTYPYPHGAEEAVYITQRRSMDVAVAAITGARMSIPAVGIQLSTLCDIYPAVSSAMSDAYGCRKLSYYGIRQALSPVRLMISRTGYRARFLVHNDRTTPYVGRLIYRVADRYNQELARGMYDVTVQAQALEEIASTELSTLVFGHETEYYLHAWLDDGRTISSSEVCLFTEPKYFSYVPQAVSTEIRGSGRRFEVILRSAAFVHGAFISFGELAATPADNLVDLTSDMPVRIEVETAGVCTAERLASSLSVISLNRIGRP